MTADRVDGANASGAYAAAPEPTETGFRDMPGYPYWLTWTAPDKSWEVTYGDDGDNILVPLSGEKAISVSAGPHAGSRWFYTDDPRGLAAALIAAADLADQQTARKGDSAPGGAA
jgi:hypothetical protein